MKAYSLDLRDRVIATYKEGRLNKTDGLLQKMKSIYTDRIK